MGSTGADAEGNAEIAGGLAVIAEGTGGTEREHDIAVYMIETTESNGLLAIIGTSRSADLETGTAAIVIDGMKTGQSGR